MPSILLLLLAGFVAGPVTGLIDPDELLGELLIPFVSASVAIVLFEGGLSLNFHELKGTRGMVWRLVTIGAAVTAGLVTLAAHFLIGLDFGLSLLIGAILIVTGPTVIGPLLRTVRPVGRVGPILRWEGILIDPIGAMLAVLVFEAVILGEPGNAPSAIAAGLMETAAVGGGVGVAAAGLMVLFLKRYLIPDFLHNAMSLTVVLGAFTAANIWVDESGLLAVTVMGIVLANQRITPVRHIIEFKETLRVLLISGLFVILAAEVQLRSIAELGFGGLAFLTTVLGARVVAVWLASLGSRLERRERIFLAAIAPRGIVAAAVSSVFALRLAGEGVADADLLAPMTFIVIIGTIVVSAGLGPRLARRLDLSDRTPEGALIVGANRLARAIGEALHVEGLKVVLVDNDYGNIAASRMRGLPVSYRSILSEEVHRQIDLSGIGRMLALTRNDELNSLAAQHMIHLFGRASVYQLPPQGDGPRKATSAHQRGRTLFADDATYESLSQRLEGGGVIKKSKLGEEFGIDDFRARYGDEALPLFLIGETGKLTVWSVDGKPTPKPGDRLLALVPPERAGHHGEVAERAEAPA